MIALFALAAGTVPLVTFDGAPYVQPRSPRVLCSCCLPLS